MKLDELNVHSNSELFDFSLYTTVICNGKHVQKTTEDFFIHFCRGHLQRTLQFKNVDDTIKKKKLGAIGVIVSVKLHENNPELQRQNFRGYY